MSGQPAHAKVGQRKAILIDQAADGDMERLAPALARFGWEPTLWSFPSGNLEVEARPGWFSIRHGERTLDSFDLEVAALIIHRKGRGWLAASSTMDNDRAFVEREWRSLFGSLLLEAELRGGGSLWINRPSISHVFSEKYYLLATADLDGLSVPRLHISTNNRLPTSHSGEYICKAIGENQDIDDHRTMATAVLPQEIAAATPFRTECPSLIQERIHAVHELRVYYLLGNFLGIRLSTHQSGYSDIRLIKRERVRVDRVEVPAGLKLLLHNYSQRHKMAYCVFDLLPYQDDYGLIDVTPHGSWSYFETPDDPFITEWYVSTLGRAIEASEHSYWNLS